MNLCVFNWIKLNNDEYMIDLLAQNYSYFIQVKSDGESGPYSLNMNQRIIH